MKKFFFAVIIIIASASIALQGQSDEQRVLFVGNSFTYFWNVPQVVQAMAKTEGVNLVTRQSTAGGASWQDHLDGAKSLTTIDKIQNSAWDIVVLQDHSRSTIDHPEEFRKNGHQLSEIIKAIGAQPLLYMTWAYNSNPLMLESISKGYKNLAKALNVSYVPIAPLFDKIRKERPDLDLFFDDIHQSALGTYVIALAFYKKLSGQTVLNIPDRISTIDQDGETTHLVFVLAKDGKFLRQCVEEFQF